MKSLTEEYLLLLARKLTEKTHDSRNGKEHYQSFIRKKNRKSVKQSEIITYQRKTFENPNIVDIKSVITEHPETYHKLSKTEIVGSNSFLYCDITFLLVFNMIKKRRYDTFYSNLKAEIIINESYIDDVFKSIYTKII